jgi:hypothetical protein
LCELRVERSLLVRGKKGFDLQGCTAGMLARCGVLVESDIISRDTCVRTYQCEGSKFFSQEFAILSVTSRKHKGEILVLLRST